MASSEAPGSPCAAFVVANRGAAQVMIPFPQAKNLTLAASIVTKL